MKATDYDVIETLFFLRWLKLDAVCAALTRHEVEHKPDNVRRVLDKLVRTGHIEAKGRGEGRAWRIAA